MGVGEPVSVAPLAVTERRDGEHEGHIRHPAIIRLDSIRGQCLR